MKEYEMFSFEEENRDIIFLTSLEDPYFIFDSIYEELAITKGTHFSITVDLFLRNGFSFNRFAFIEFFSKDDYRTKIINTRDISEKAKSCIKRFLMENDNYLIDSALSKRTIEFVMSA